MVLYKHSDEPKGNAPISSSLFSQLQKDILTGKLKPGQCGKLCASWKWTGLCKIS